MFYNEVLNGSFDQWYRQSASQTAGLDDGYFAPKWFTLLQGAGATVGQSSGISGDVRLNHCDPNAPGTISGKSAGLAPELKANTACKLVAGGTANRFGIAQIIEAASTRNLRGDVVLMQAVVRPTLNAGSGSMDVRFALLAWTGTPDAVTSDIVDSWTSSTYTPGAGNFFAATNLALIATGKSSVAHNEWERFWIAGTVPSTATNLILMIWAEDVPAHAADFLEITEVGVHYGWGDEQRWFERPNERQLCERFCQRLEPSNFGGEYLLSARIGGVGAAAAKRIDGYAFFPTMRAIPSFTHGITAWATTTATAGQVNFFDDVVNGFATITGALTFTGLVIGPNSLVIRASAGTSFSGANGNAGRFGIGNDDYLVLSAEL